MAGTFVGKSCTPCKGGIPPLTRQRPSALTRRLELRDKARQIERIFRFEDFDEVLTLVRKVGKLAETEGHHPDICFG